MELIQHRCVKMFIHFQSTIQISVCCNRGNLIGRWLTHLNEIYRVEIFWKYHRWMRNHHCASYWWFDDQHWFIAIKNLSWNNCHVSLSNMQNVLSRRPVKETDSGSVFYFVSSDIALFYANSAFLRFQCIFAIPLLKNIPWWRHISTYLCLYKLINLPSCLSVCLSVE